jgi:hypothetical protein
MKSVLINLSIIVVIIFNLADKNMIIMDKKIEEKKDILSLKLKNLKEDYTNIINSNIKDTEVIKISLLKQIEVLIELINTIKLKINLIQQSENRV